MNKELKTELTKEEKIEKVLSEEEHRERKEKFKKEFRRTNLEYRGRLFIDEKFKKPGKVLRIDNDDPQTRQMMAQLGYTIVQDPDLKVGSGSLNETNNMGSAVHIEQGITFSQPGILYEIDEDLYEARKEIEAEENRKIFETTVAANRYDGQIDKL